MKYYNEITKIVTSNPTIPNVLNATHETIIKNGWKIYQDNIPLYDSNTHYLVKTNVIVDGDYANQQYDIIQTPPEYVSEITSAQGMAMLVQMNIYETVINIISEKNDTILDIFWQKSHKWRIDSPIVSEIAQQLNIEIESFFIDASKINI